MSEWKEFEFSEFLVDESISYGIVQPGPDVRTDSVPIIRVQNIKNGVIDTSDVRHVSKDVEKKFYRTRLQGGELLITVVGSIGETAIVPESLKGWNVARAVSVARIKNSFNKIFIKYLFATEDAIFQMYGNTNDTVQPTLNLKELKKLVFNLPDQPEQDKIASVLSSLDDKIDLLHRQSQTLEQMAETLFRQWFVENPNPDWDERPLSDFGQIICGKTPSKKKTEYFDGEYPFIKIPDMHGKTFVFDTQDSLSEEGFLSQKKKALPAKSINVSCIATVGLVTMNAFPSQTNQQINSIIPDEDFRYYLYCEMKNSYDLLHAMASGGTATLNLNTGNFSKIPVLEPGEDSLERFNQLVTPMFDKIFKNQTQIRTLTALRDTLLPKLMSGKVKVSEL